jgi:hypothetical protein
MKEDNINALICSGGAAEASYADVGAVLSPRLRILFAYHLTDFSLAFPTSIRALTSSPMRR